MLERLKGLWADLIAFSPSAVSFEQCSLLVDAEPESIFTAIVRLSEDADAVSSFEDTLYKTNLGVNDMEYDVAIQNGDHYRTIVGQPEFLQHILTSPAIDRICVLHEGLPEYKDFFLHNVDPEAIDQTNLVAFPSRT